MNENQQISKDLLLDILNQCTDEVYVFKPDGSLIFVNEATNQENGCMEELETRNILDIFPKLLGVSHHEITLLDHSQDEIREAFAYRKNQTCYPVHVKFNWTTIQEERYGIITASNITELKVARKREKIFQQELEDAKSIKNMFIANVTHELRTPVNGMKGLADLLIDTELSPKQRENVNIIRRCCDTMSNLINQILDFTKADAGKLELESAEFDFQQFMKNTIAVHMPMLNKKGLTLQVNVGENVPHTIIGDELRLGQVLNNLISNAVKFTSVGRIVVEVVNTFEDEKQLELFFMVMDSGIGIAKEEMDKLFHSFSQVDGSITRQYGGTGLGLSISKKLVELMNGSIYVDSEKGKGSTFSFSARFPKKLGEVAKMPSNPPITVEQTQEQHKSIRLQLGETAPTSEEETFDLKTLSDYEEKLVVCLELEIWEKAEDYASSIHKLIPEDMEEIRKQALRLLLAVRKENLELSIQQLEALKILIS